MELKEVLDRATERPWRSKLALGDYEGHTIRSPSDKLVAITATAQATTLDEKETANGILIPHAVNNLKPLLEAAKSVLEQEQSMDCSDWEPIERLREAVRQTEEVSP